MDNAQDNSPAFASHWVKAQPVISGLIFGSITNRHDGEDVLQEVAVTAAKDFDQYDPSRPFLPWVLTITRHRIVDHFRKKKRIAISFDEEMLEVLSESACRVSQQISEREMALSQCIRRLPERGKRILEMRYHLDMAADAIGQRLNLSSTAVYSALHRLRVALGKCIDQHIQDGGRDR